ncbi:MAG: PRC-barrel domain protein [Firmicutes bacterium]|nr:PRC-barrel domain protein [Bacillota bacterium]
MVKVSDFIGLEVLTVENGQELGRVHQVVLDYEKAQLCGFILSEATLFTFARGILFEDIANFGLDAITVSTSCEVKDFSQLLEAPGIFLLESFKNKELFSACGQYLGIITDLLCNLSNGSITYLELSDGLIYDFVYGRKTLPLPAFTAIHEDRLIVPEGS